MASSSTSVWWRAPSRRSLVARQRAIDEVSTQVAALVLSVARQVIGREVDAEQHRALIDEAIAALRVVGASPRPPAPRPDADADAGGPRIVHPSLRGYATAVVESAVEADAGDRVADELVTVEDLLAREGGLTAVLTDSVVPSPSRRGVIEELLPSRRARRDAAPGPACPGRRPGRPVSGRPCTTCASWPGPGRHCPSEAELEETVHGRIAVRAMLAGYATAVFETLASVSELEAARGRALPVRAGRSSRVRSCARRSATRRGRLPTARRW